MISFYVDDYGYTPSTSKDIIECIREDEIDGISIMCNTSNFDDLMNLLYENIKCFKRLK